MGSSQASVDPPPLMVHKTRKRRGSILHGSSEDALLEKSPENASANRVERPFGEFELGGVVFCVL